MEEEIVQPIHLPHNFTPRSFQKPFFDYMNNGGKRAVLVWSRRSGKDTCSWNFLITAAIEKKGIYYYIFPTFTQGRKILWDGMTHSGFKFLEFIPKPLISKINNQEMKLTLINGSIIQVVGSDNYDAIRGTNPSGCIFSEYAEQDPNVWQVVSPILDANDGWAIFVFTPKGTNHAKMMYDQAKANKSWYCSHLTCLQTRSLDTPEMTTEQRIEKIRKEGLMSEDMIQQEHFCSFTLGIQGSYYAKYLEEARKENRIGNISWDKQARVHTAWDIGIGDSTSIVFFQICGNEIHYIDYYESHGEGLPHYASILKSKPYLYGSHFAPHDIRNHEFSTGSSRLEVAAELGIRFTVLDTLKKWGFEDGVEAVRGLFPRFWIDEKKCMWIIKALENYRKEYDEKNETYKMRPKHDKWSHCADAIRYAAIGIKSRIDADRGPSDDDVDRMMDKWKPRFS